MLEPLALGLLAAPSWAGAYLSVAVVAAFLARRPLQQCATIPEAGQALVGLGVLSLSMLGLTVWRAGLPALLPLIVSVPAVLVFLSYDTYQAARTEIAEIAGVAAFAFVPAALALCGGRSHTAAIGLATLMLARSIPTVLVVRAYVRRRKGKPGGAVAAILVSAAAVLVIAGLATARKMPIADVLLVLMLFLRAIWLLGAWRPDFSARQIGVAECFLGGGFVVAAGLSI